MARGVTDIGRFWGLALGEEGHPPTTYCHRGQGLTCTRQALIFSSVSLAVYTQVNYRNGLFFLTRIILYFEVIFLIKLNYVV